MATDQEILEVAARNAKYIYRMEIHIDHLERKIDWIGEIASRVGTSAQKADWRKRIAGIAKQEGLVMGHENVPFGERGNQ